MVWNLNDLTNPGSILIVEDDPLVQRSLTRFFSRFRRVVAATTVAEARLALTQGERLCAALIDWKLPDEDGVTLLREIRAELPTIPVLMVTAYLDKDCINQAHTLRAEYICKPLNRRNLQAFADRIVTLPSESRVQRALNEYCRQHSFSPQEARIAELTIAGIERSTLATELGVAESTVKTVVRRLLRKCGLSSLEMLERTICLQATTVPDLFDS